MKKTKTYWRKKCSELAKKIQRDKYKTCQMCGAGGDRRLHAHHLLSEGAYPQMSGYLDNIIVICASCHLFGKVSFHGTPFEMVERFNQKFPGRYERLKKIAIKRQNVDYEAEYKELNKKL